MGRINIQDGALTVMHGVAVPVGQVYLMEPACVVSIPVGDLVALLRLRQGLSLRELAKRSQVGLGTLSNIEQKRSQSPQVHTLVKLASVFGFNSASVFFDGSVVGSINERYEIRSGGTLRGRVLRVVQLHDPGTGIYELSHTDSCSA